MTIKKKARGQFRKRERTHNNNRTAHCRSIECRGYYYGQYQRQVGFEELVSFLHGFFKEATEDTIFELLTDGVKEHERVEARSKELLEKAMKTLGVKEIEVDNKKGYLVEGQLSSYFVAKESDGNHRNTTTGKVYKYPSMAYVCMVEKTGVKRVGNDLLVNRFYALANDSVLIKEISTLN